LDKTCLTLLDGLFSKQSPIDGVSAGAARRMARVPERSAARKARRFGARRSEPLRASTVLAFRPQSTGGWAETPSR
jgi:hypothetical protein